MLCTVELMLAGLCINIPMLRPFYLQWRKTYKSQSGSHNLSAIKRSNTGGLGSHQQPRPGHYTQWMELVSLIQCLATQNTRLIRCSTTRIKQTSPSQATMPARNENSPHQSHCLSTRYRYPRISRLPEPKYRVDSASPYPYQDRQLGLRRDHVKDEAWTQKTAVCPIAAFTLARRNVGDSHCAAAQSHVERCCREKSFRTWQIHRARRMGPSSGNPDCSTCTI